MASSNPLNSSSDFTRVVLRVAGFAVLVALVIALVMWIRARMSAEQPITYSDKDIPNLTSDGAAASNTPQRDQMKLRRGTPKIDGDLADWHPEDGFETAPDRLKADKDPGALTLKDNKTDLDRLNHFYTVRGMMMEDPENLYIAAKIGDPRKRFFENKNVVKNLDELTVPQVPPSYLQVRIYVGSDDNASAETRSVTLLLWHSKNTNDVYLGIKAGIKEDETSPAPVVKPRIVASGNEGFTSIFKNSGNDCIIEAKIPWTVIKMRPSPETKELRCIWQAIWNFGKTAPNVIRVVELVRPGQEETVRQNLQKSIVPSVDKWGAITRP